jgi:hypothetical protein
MRTGKAYGNTLQRLWFNPLPALAYSLEGFDEASPPAIPSAVLQLLRARLRSHAGGVHRRPEANEAGSQLRGWGFLITRSADLSTLTIEDERGRLLRFFAEHVCAPPLPFPGKML